jgi:hypothetical protein
MWARTAHHSFPFALRVNLWTNGQSVPIPTNNAGIARNLRSRRYDDAHLKPYSAGVYAATFLLLGAFRNCAIFFSTAK